MGIRVAYLAELTVLQVGILSAMQTPRAVLKPSFKPLEPIHVGLWVSSLDDLDDDEPRYVVVFGFRNTREVVNRMVQNVCHNLMLLGER